MFIHNNVSEASSIAAYNLHSGVNLIGFPVLSQDVSTESVLENLESNGQSIIGEGEASANIGGNYVGSLNAINHTSGYWLKVGTDDVLLVPGSRVDCEETNYSLHFGNNLISYNLYFPTLIEDALPYSIDECLFVCWRGLHVVMAGIGTLNVKFHM